MFYSQTFLARKGPLGTVWCAAHVQHRLKKSHYTSTDISSTVDCIMFPEVPIALRMSGHLLFGVVRIYSKKVDYLYHDCNVARVALIKAFASKDVNLNLPESATAAMFDAVTLPLTFDLDDFDIDDDMDSNRFLDDHTRSPEEITLQDQIHIDSDPYVAVPYEDMMMDTLPPEHDDSGVRNNISEDGNMASPSPIPSNQTEVPAGNVPPGSSNQTAEGKDTEHLEENNQGEPTIDFQDHDLSKEREHLNTAPNDDNFPPEIEVMRDQSNIIPDSTQPFEDFQNDISEPNQSSNRGPEEQKSPGPFEDVLPFQEETSPFHQNIESPNIMHSHEASKIIDSLDLQGHMPSELKMRSTPPVQSPKPRQRKRKYFFDESTVLSNKFIKTVLENSSDILRKRREIPTTSLGIWKMSNALRKEQVFSEPSLTGSCADICHLFKKDFISTKPHLTLQREVTPEPMVVAPSLENEPTHMLTNKTSSALAGEVMQEASNATSVLPTEVVTEPMNVTLSVEPSIPEYEPQTDIEIEHLRHADGLDGNSMVHELVPSPDRALHSPGFPSPFRTDEFTPHSPKSIGTETVHFTETSTGTSLLHTQDYTAEMETPRTDLERQFDAGQFGLSYIPESGNIAGTEDLSFLEADNSVFGYQGSQGIDTLSVRTRAVAQYLLRQSPVASISEDEPEDLSLNKILEGKTRKLCARMFFETLVLKSYGLIDVRQEQAYGDISLKLTSTLAKSQI